MESLSYPGRTLSGMRDITETLPDDEQITAMARMADEVFGDPVTYLRLLGLETELVSEMIFEISEAA